MLITGAGGQLGSALVEVFPEADARSRETFDITYPPELASRPDLVFTRLPGPTSTGAGRTLPGPSA